MSSSRRPCFTHGKLKCPPTHARVWLAYIGNARGRRSHSNHTRGWSTNVETRGVYDYRLEVPCCWVPIVKFEGGYIPLTKVSDSEG